MKDKTTANKPRLLDLFCGAGGCTKGYQAAGFYVVGVDIDPQKNYIGDDFIQADALEILRTLTGGGCIIGQSGRRYFLADFDLISASPPCQAHSKLNTIHKNIYRDYIPDTRKLLQKAGKPYVIENVEGAPLENPLTLCGTMFGLKVVRHRLFECNPVIWWPPVSCNHDTGRIPRVGLGANERGFITVVGHFPGVEAGKKAMGISWMVRDELSQAIPPAYTEYIGKQMIKLIGIGEATR